MRKKAQRYWRRIQGLRIYIDGVEHYYIPVAPPPPNTPIVRHLWTRSKMTIGGAPPVQAVPSEVVVGPPSVEHTRALLDRLAAGATAQEVWAGLYTPSGLGDAPPPPCDPFTDNQSS